MPGIVELRVVWLAEVRPRPEDFGRRERARFERLKIEAKRDQFAAAQTALRGTLAGHTRSTPGAVRFAYGEHGKPWLPDHPELGFNMTHSEDLALIATGRGIELGVDVEFLGRDRPFLRLAQRYFAAPEQAWLEALPESEHRAAFYRTWVLKEAYLKALGTGLTVSPASFELDLSERPARWVDAQNARSDRRPEDPDAGAAPVAWSFAEIDVDEGYAAAVCADRPITGLTVRRD